jgi:chromosome segregation ATPase
VDQDEKLEEAKREIVTLGRELESMEEKYRGAHEDLLEERTENHLHSQSIQSNYDKLAADKYDADVRIEALETELAKVKEEESILQKNHDVLQVNTVKLEETVKDLEIQVERATDDHVQELQRTHGILQAHHARLEETVKGLEEQVKHATDDHVQKPSVSETGSEETVTPAGEYLKHEKQRLENELETARIDHVLELSVLEAEAEQAVINARESLQIKLENLKEENATLRTKSAEKDTELQRLQEQLQDHFQEVSVLEAEAEETVTNARDSFSREKERLETELEITKDENATLRTEAAEIDKELQRLRFKLQDQSSTQIEMLTKERDLLISKFKEQKTKYAKSHSESQSTITTLQTRVNDLTTTNATINTSLKSTTKDLSKTRQLVKIAEFETKAALREKQKVSTEFEMMKKKTEAINAGFDKGVEEMMKARNEEWRRKYEALKKERGVMSKVLMKEWGEKECGAMEPCQGYRYKYI